MGVLGTPLSDQAYKQSTVSTAHGGLGVRRVSDHAGGAFAASWHESMKTSGVFLQFLQSMSLRRFPLCPSTTAQCRISKIPPLLGTDAVWRGWSSPTPMHGSLPSPLLQTARTLSCRRRSSSLPFVVFSACPFFLINPPAPFVCKPWIFMAITPYAAKGQEIRSQGTIGSGI